LPNEFKAQVVASSRLAAARYQQAFVAAHQQLKAPIDKLVEITVEMVEHIRQEIRIVDFWRNTHAQNVLGGWIVGFLDDGDAIPFTRQQAAGDRIVELAKALLSRLTTGANPWLLASFILRCNAVGAKLLVSQLSGKEN